MTSASSRQAGVGSNGGGVPRSRTADDGRADRRLQGGSARGARRYLLLAFTLAACGLGLIAVANRSYAPEMYDSSRLGIIADAFSNGQNYGVFDLNINIRRLRDEQISRLKQTPDVIILGASQWQEASTDLLANRHAFNAHVHRDYYEDVLGVVEMLVRNDKLPRDLVITVRDRLFTPVAQRTDTLWLPGIPDFTAMARRLALEPHGVFETQPLQRPRELISLAMLATNAARWHNASSHPHPTLNSSHPDLDLLHPDGSITWSQAHLRMFSQERSRKLSIAHADASRNRPPMIEPKGVEALDRLLTYLGLRGVRVHLAHPPFNPLFFDRVQDSPYMDGLRQVEAVTRELAARHKLGLVGSFDPTELGCTAEMYIDAEHANANCLSLLMADIAASIDLPPITARSPIINEAAASAETVQLDPVASDGPSSEAVYFESTEPQILAEAPAETPLQTLEEAPVEAPHQIPTQPPAEVVDAVPPASTAETPTAVAGAEPAVIRATAEATPAAPAVSKADRVRGRRLAAASTPARSTNSAVSRPTPAPKRLATNVPRELVWPGDQPKTYR